jgi:hypothetical protein
MAVPAPPGFPVDEALAARRAIVAFWHALGTDDEAALAEVLHPPVWERLAGQVAAGDRCRAVRDWLHLTRDQCALMGVSTTAVVLVNGRYVFNGHPTTRNVIHDRDHLDPDSRVIAAARWGRRYDRWYAWAHPGPTTEELDAALRVVLPIGWGPDARA